MILYIHFNPVKHGIESNFVIYPYSTFKEFFTDRSSPIKKEEVIDWFDGYGEFFNLHRVIDKDDLIKNMIKDD